jgi:hypothetical protein
MMLSERPFWPTSPLNPWTRRSGLAWVAVEWKKIQRRRSMSIFVIAMLSVWALLVLVVIALYIYRGKLTQDEEDELFLDDAFKAEREAQAVIAAKVAKIEPTIRMARWLALAATVVVVVYYIHDFLVQFQ